MSSEPLLSDEDGPDRDLAKRLGYLLKHAQLRLTELSDQALSPLGIDGRALNALLVLASREPLSQQQAARRLRIDRTTMVALLDVLEAKGFVLRQQHPQDRRRNTLELTHAGQAVLARGLDASDAAEQAFLAVLSPQAKMDLRDALSLVVTGLGADR
jgi:DNA-binding MarR family transcriptional regulator